MNPLKAMKLRKNAEDFEGLHPRFSRFMKENYLQNLKEDTVIKVIIQNPEGEAKSAAMKISKTDLRIIESFKKELFS